MSETFRRDGGAHPLLDCAASTRGWHQGRTEPLLLQATADVWEAAEAVLTSPSPEFVPRFVHTDYQHFNLLWRRESAPLHPWFDLYRLTHWSVHWEDFIPTQVGGRGSTRVVVAHQQA